MSNQTTQEFIVAGSLLLLCAIMDWKTKKIALPLLGVYMIAGVIWRMVVGNESIVSLGIGMLLGGGLLLISYVTREAVGYGDGLLLLVTGCILGAEKNFILFFCALVLSAFYSAFLLLIKRVKRTHELAFVPFLFMAYTGMVIYERFA